MPKFLLQTPVPLRGPPVPFKPDPLYLHLLSPVCRWSLSQDGLTGFFNSTMVRKQDTLSRNYFQFSILTFPQTSKVQHDALSWRWAPTGSLGSQTTTRAWGRTRTLATTPSLTFGVVVSTWRELFTAYYKTGLVCDDLTHLLPNVSVSSTLKGGQAKLWCSVG